MAVGGLQVPTRCFLFFAILLLLLIVSDDLHNSVIIYYCGPKVHSRRVKVWNLLSIVVKGFAFRRKELDD